MLDKLLDFLTTDVIIVPEHTISEKTLPVWIIIALIVGFIIINVVIEKIRLYKIERKLGP